MAIRQSAYSSCPNQVSYADCVSGLPNPRLPGRMDYRPETVAAKAIDVLLAGVPVGAILSRGLRLLLQAKASASVAAAATKASVLAVERAAAAKIPVVFGHGARHLKDTGLGVGDVEAAIRQQVQAAVAAGDTASGSFWGRVTVQGVIVEYRAHTLENGLINVGTYYVADLY